MLEINCPSDDVTTASDDTTNVNDRIVERIENEVSTTHKRLQQSAAKQANDQLKACLKKF